MSDVTVACGLYLGRLIDQFKTARAGLSNALDVPVYDLSDHREDTWNGDHEYPQWEWLPDNGEWNYSAESRGAFQRGNLTFIRLRLSGGETTLGVFSNDKIEDHEEC